jgi:hypothetical protein
VIVKAASRSVCIRADGTRVVGSCVVVAGVAGAVDEGARVMGSLVSSKGVVGAGNEGACILVGFGVTIFDIAPGSTSVLGALKGVGVDGVFSVEPTVSWAEVSNIFWTVAMSQMTKNAYDAPLDGFAS